MVGRADLKACTSRCTTDVGRHHIGLALKAVGHLPVGRDAAQVAVGIVVGVEDAYLGHARLAITSDQVVKEHGLGSPVGLQAAVNVLKGMEIFQRHQASLPADEKSAETEKR